MTNISYTQIKFKPQQKLFARQLNSVVDVLKDHEARIQYLELLKENGIFGFYQEFSSDTPDCIKVISPTSNSTTPYEFLKYGITNTNTGKYDKIGYWDEIIQKVDRGEYRTREGYLMGGLLEDNKLYAVIEEIESESYGSIIVFLFSTHEFTWEGTKAKAVRNTSRTPTICGECEWLEEQPLTIFTNLRPLAGAWKYDKAKGYCWYTDVHDTTKYELTATYCSCPTTGSQSNYEETALGTPFGAWSSWENLYNTTSTLIPPSLVKSKTTIVDSEFEHLLISLMISEFGTFNLYNSNLLGDDTAAFNEDTIWDSNQVTNVVKVTKKNKEGKDVVTYHHIYDKIDGLRATSYVYGTKKTSGPGSCLWYVNEQPTILAYALRMGIPADTRFLYRGAIYKYHLLPNCPALSHEMPSAIVFKYKKLLTTSDQTSDTFSIEYRLASAVYRGFVVDAHPARMLQDTFLLTQRQRIDICVPLDPINHADMLNPAIISEDEKFEWESKYETSAQHHSNHVGFCPDLLYFLTRKKACFPMFSMTWEDKNVNNGTCQWFGPKFYDEKIGITQKQTRPFIFGYIDQPNGNAEVGYSARGFDITSDDPDNAPDVHIYTYLSHHLVSE